MVIDDTLSNSEVVLLFKIAQFWIDHLMEQLLEEKQKNEALNLRLLDVELKLGELGK